MLINDNYSYLTYDFWILYNYEHQGKKFIYESYE